MKAFQDNEVYRPSDDAMRLIATKGTLAVWRHERRGPKYIRLGGRVLYRGSDLNAWLDERVVETDPLRDTPPERDASLREIDAGVAA